MLRLLLAENLLGDATTGASPVASSLSAQTNVNAHARALFLDRAHEISIVMNMDCTVILS